MSIVIGLTGPTGSGKSVFTKKLEALGIKVINCDFYARKAVEPGSAGLAALENAFGKEIITEDGTLDRKKLAAAAFSAAEKTELLNDTIFPHILKLVKAEMNAEKVVLDAPLLFESGLDKLCDQTIAVLADSEVRLKRIIPRDGLTLSEARLRLSAGKPDDFYKQRADYVFYNNKDGKSFEKNLIKLIKTIFGGQPDV